MAIINYSDQLKYAGKGYIDAKMMPVQTVDDLKAIPITQRFEGFTVTVLNNGNPRDYWLVGGVANKYWVPKTVNGNHKDLKLTLEEGFLKLSDNEGQIGESVDLNQFFPEFEDLFIKTVDYVTENEKGEKGVFLCFTYSDESKMYLDMSYFLSKTYESGDGIVINGNVISLDDAIKGKITLLEEQVTTNTVDIENIKNRLESINSILTKVNENSDKINEHDKEINDNKNEIAVLKDKVNALSSASEGSTPDGVTIGITDDEQKALYVKILEKEGNLIKIDSHNGSNGLFASIPIFYEDEELN